MERRNNHLTRHMFLFHSWIAKCPVLSHLFGCFDWSLKENIYCHSAAIIGDINKLSKKLLKTTFKVQGAPSLLLSFKPITQFSTK